MSLATRLVIATGNEGKARELRALLPPDFEVMTAASLGVGIPEETGFTFADNARIKAVGVSRRLPDLVLADDSGLEVAALGGRPGVHSARYAGQSPSDTANVALLLRELSSVPEPDRAARFVCVLCLARAGDVLALVEGDVVGRIAHEPTGESGFGYDPVFVTADGRTMAQLDPSEKNEISHRGTALRRMIPSVLKQVTPGLQQGDDR